MINEAIHELSETQQLQEEVDALKKEVGLLEVRLASYERGWPPGHFYSPIPCLEEVLQQEEKIWGTMSKELPGINLNEAVQLRYLDALACFYQDLPWQDQKQEHLRYYFQNPNFTYGEAIILSCFLRCLKPQRIIEIGSGYSSCVILDTDEVFLDRTVSKTFIEPYPALLESLLKPGDLDRIQIEPRNLQEVSVNRYKELTAGDILFIDSTHVSKVNSDVNEIFFTILPQLNSGVYIHIHDIYYPFEYPKEWVCQGRAWNEAYLLRAFLQNNDAFEIVFFNSFIGHFHYDQLERTMPLCAKNPGTSIWIRKR